jgi:NAD(P)-dependent dehydrogenase (short-subunit alcohol dehydrogenase family)
LAKINPSPTQLPSFFSHSVIVESPPIGLAITTMAVSRVWHISGANTGFGLALALKAVQEGDKVVAAVRSPNKVPDSLKRPDVAVAQFDLTWSQDEIDAYAKKTFGLFGRIDVLVNNAAYAYMGAIEESR